MSQLAAQHPLPPGPDDNSGYDGRRDLKREEGRDGGGSGGQERGSQSEMLGHKAVRATHLFT